MSMRRCSTSFLLLQVHFIFPPPSSYFHSFFSILSFVKATCIHFFLIHSFFFSPPSSRFPLLFTPSPLSLHPPLLPLHSSVLRLTADSIIALLLRSADSLSVLTVGFKHTKSMPERNRYFATEISPFPGEYSLK